MNCNVNDGMVADFRVGVGEVCRDEFGEVLGCVVLHQHVGWEMRVAEARTDFFTSFFVD